jgi:ArsR family transcriptional regulator
MVKIEHDFESYDKTAELLKVLAHPVRLCIVKGLLKNGGCNVSHMQDCLKEPQSTVSQHLQKLKTAGVISGTRKGKEISYSVSDKRIEALIKILLP